MPVRVIGNQLYLYGAVGSDPFGEDGFSAEEVVEALSQFEADAPVVVRLNSGGGHATEGVAIHSVLRRHPGEVTVLVEGIAASAASLIAIAGDEVIMGAGALFMIHDPATMTYGTAAAHSAVRDTLEKHGSAYATLYAERTGKPAREMRDLMRIETWMTASEAVDLGFADAVEHLGEDEGNQPTAFAYASYTRAPKALAALAKARGWNARALTPAALSAPLEEIDMSNVGRKRLTANQLASVVAALEGSHPKLAKLFANSKVVLETATEKEKDEDETKEETTETKTTEQDAPAEKETDEDKEKEEAPVASTETEEEKKDEPEVDASNSDEESKDEDAEKGKDQSEDDKQDEEDDAAEQARASDILKIVASTANIYPNTVKADIGKDFVRAGYSVAQVRDQLHAMVCSKQSKEVSSQTPRTADKDARAVWAKHVTNFNNRAK